MDLEAYFQQVVEEARDEGGDVTGSTGDAGVADYLSADVQS